MDRNRPSRTAQGIAGARARESSKPEGERLFFDPYSRHFIGRRLRAMSRLPFLLRLYRWHNARVLPGMFGGLVLRTRYIDDLLISSLEAGAEQVIILGAGYDSRAYRLEQMSRGVRVFEVDHPATQRVKMNTLARLFGGLPDHVSFVPVRFQEGGLGKRLQQAGYRGDLKSFFIWEGVTMYLDSESLEATLAFIASQSSPGSGVVFDYFPPSVAQGSCPLREARTLARLLARCGEEIRLGLDPRTVVDFLDLRGLRVRQHLTAFECSHLYFRPGQAHPPVSRLFHFVFAEVQG